MKAKKKFRNLEEGLARLVKIGDSYKPKRKPAPLANPKLSKAIRVLGEAARLLREEQKRAEQRKDYTLVVTYSHYASRIEEVISDERGEQGLQPLLEELRNPKRRKS